LDLSGNFAAAVPSGKGVPGAPFILRLSGLVASLIAQLKFASSPLSLPACPEYYIGIDVSFQVENTCWDFKFG